MAEKRERARLQGAKEGGSKRQDTALLRCVQDSLTGVRRRRRCSCCVCERRQATVPLAGSVFFRCLCFFWRPLEAHADGATLSLEIEADQSSKLHELDRVHGYAPGQRSPPFVFKIAAGILMRAVSPATLFLRRRRSRPFLSCASLASCTHLHPAPLLHSAHFSSSLAPLASAPLESALCSSVALPLLALSIAPLRSLLPAICLSSLFSSSLQRNESVASHRSARHRRV